MRMKALGFCLLALVGCGKDETDFEDLKGQVGVVAGNFNLALLRCIATRSTAARQDRQPGARPDVTADAAFQRRGRHHGRAVTKLSDLLKVKIPGTQSEIINQQIFKELQKLSGDGGPMVRCR